MAKEKKTLTKDMIPDDFSLGLALTDGLPVIFFGINTLLLGMHFGSKLFLLGAIVSFLSGAGKVLWKVIVAVKRKNIWWLFMQMRIFMPAGFLLMLFALFVDHRLLDGHAFMAGFTSMPSFIFFLFGILSLILMTVFAFTLNNSDLKSNWIEQTTNAIGQLCFMIGLFLL